MKDYYQILELAPGADAREIRKSYRRLVMKYHPDKNGNDPYADALFRDVQEAYEILIDPGRKRAYFEQRWYDDFLAKRKERYEAITPASILKRALQFDRFVADIDVFRFDHAQLARFVIDLLDEKTLSELRSFDEPQVMDKIGDTLLHASRSIHFKQIPETFAAIGRLPASAIRQRLDAELKRRRTLHRWESLKVVIALAVTVIVCLLIWLATRTR